MDVDDGFEMGLQICATEPNEFIDSDKHIDVDQDFLMISDSVFK